MTVCITASTYTANRVFYSTANRAAGSAASHSPTLPSYVEPLQVGAGAPPSVDLSRGRCRSADAGESFAELALLLLRLPLLLLRMRLDRPPLAIVVLGGLTTSTLLNLVVIPAGYLIIYGRGGSQTELVEENKELMLDEY